MYRWLSRRTPIFVWNKGGCFLSFIDCSSPFYFLIIEFHCPFYISYKIQRNFIYYYCILIWIVQDVNTSFSFVPALLLSTLTCLFLTYVTLSSYFFIAVPIHECLGTHSCMSSSFSLSILNGTCFFPTVQLQVHYVYSERKIRNTYALVKL